MRKLLVSLAILLALLVVADRVAVSVASGVVASQLRTSGELRSDPSVTITGFPFLTQALAGRYDRIEVSASGLSRGGVRVSQFDATVRDAQLPLSDALGGSVSAVPVSGLTATAVVTYADVVSAGKLAGARLTPVAGGVRVSARISVLGQTVMASATSAVTLARGDIVITARSVTVQGQSSPALDAALAGMLDFRVKVGTLPYDLELTGVSATSAGLVLTARSGPTVLKAVR